MFRKKSLTGILKTFDKVTTQLNDHLERKTTEQFELLSDKNYIEELISENAEEVDRTHRVLAKVQELVA